MEQGRDIQIRLAAFAYLREQCRRRGFALPRDLLLEGFDFEGERVPLVSPAQGIFKPRILRDAPISILSVPVLEGKARPYDDRLEPEGFLLYRYRGVDPDHPDNRGLREAMIRRLPLIYFHGIVPGRYLAIWPVFIVGDEPERLSFHVAVDDLQIDDAMSEARLGEGQVELRRRYITALAKKRIHQEDFRIRVVHAYGRHCAVCRLRHAELLDAAHIIPDSEPEGRPEIPNGIALCKLHHAAFDENILGIRPDLLIELRRDILEERDGPMLIHGLQGFQDHKIHAPHRAAWKPNPRFLEIRYERFRSA